MEHGESEVACFVASKFGLGSQTKGTIKRCGRRVTFSCVCGNNCWNVVSNASHETDLRVILRQKLQKRTSATGAVTYTCEACHCD